MFILLMTVAVALLVILAGFKIVKHRRDMQKPLKQESKPEAFAVKVRENFKKSWRRTWKVITTTANFCLVCGRKFQYRAPGQIQFYCSGYCRKRRQNKNGARALKYARRYL